MSDGFRNSPAPRQRADGWFEHLRQACRDIPLEPDSQQVSDVSSETMLAFYRGELSEEQRRELEANALASPICFRKLAQVGACVAGEPVDQHFETMPKSEYWGAWELPAARSFSSWVAALELPQIAVRIEADRPLEIRRVMINGVQQVRVDRLGEDVGSLVVFEYGEAEMVKSFAVCRRASTSGSAAITAVPTNVPADRPLQCTVRHVAPQDLQKSDAETLWQSFQMAARIDPASVSPIDAPRSPWVMWVDSVLIIAEQQPDCVTTVIREIVARISSELG